MGPPENAAAALSQQDGDAKADMKRGYKRSSTTNRPAGKQSRQARWAEQHPLAKWAHAATRSALKSGLIKKGPCEVCGTTENIDLHHPRWDRPLETVALCRRHHRQLHSRLDKAKAGEQ